MKRIHKDEDTYNDHIIDFEFYSKIKDKILKNFKQEKDVIGLGFQRAWRMVWRGASTVCLAQHLSLTLSL